MIVRALDTNGDWLFGKGQNDYLRNNAAIAQCIQTRVLSFLGNCFFDLGAGIDWFTFLGGSKNQALLNLSISTVILNTPGNVVTGVLQVFLNLNERTRAFTVQYRVQTIYSQVAGTFSYDVNGTT